MTQINSGVVTHLELDIVECEVKWAFGSTTMNKASGGDGIPAGLFQILKDDAVKVLLSRSSNLEKSAMATGLEKVSFIPIPKKGNAKECSDYHTIVFISHASKSMLKILLVIHEPRTSRCTSCVSKRQRNQRSNCQHSLDHRESKGIPGKHLLH